MDGQELPVYVRVGGGTEHQVGAIGTPRDMDPLLRAVAAAVKQELRTHATAAAAAPAEQPPPPVPSPAEQPTPADEPAEREQERPARDRQARPRSDR